MNIMFNETIFPSVIKKVTTEKSYVGGFDFWFEKTIISSNLMVRCPNCNTVFCLEANVVDEKILRMGIRNQGYYFAQLIKKQCNGCLDSMMYR